MREFIKSIFDEKKKINFNFLEYDTFFVREEYYTYYLFFFLNSEDELLELKNKAGELYQAIKSNKEIYKVEMEKNITCIYCLGVGDAQYYETEMTGTISELSKKICLVEEDLNYFKKNVLLYTKEMDDFANENIGEFDSLCQKYITQSNFEEYKKSNKENYQYDFLINLFIKLPCLNYKKYQVRSGEKYKSVEEFIEEEYTDKKINKDYINKQIEQLEHNIDDENSFYMWLDELIKVRKEKENSILVEVLRDED